MVRNYYSEINLHVVWHTKESLPLLTPEVEQVVHRHLRRKCVETSGVYVHEIGGTDNHIHMCLTVAPTVLVSELIGQVKGASSHEANQKVGGRRKVLHWQAGYGVVSFGTKDLEWVKAYVRNQRQHHARSRAQERLERITAVEDEGASHVQSAAVRRPASRNSNRPQRLRNSNRKTRRGSARGEAFRSTRGGSKTRSKSGPIRRVARGSGRVGKGR